MLNWNKKRKWTRIQIKRKPKKQPYYTGVGLVLGVAFGVAIDNIGLRAAPGLVIGAALDHRKNKDD